MRTSYEQLKKLVGQGVDAIDTPAAVVDLDAMQRNLNRMAEFARKHAIRWRPHAKMHKSVAIARLQLQAGACGVCVQKTAEAEVMAAGGITDIFISNEVIAPHKLARVALLAHRLAADGGQLAIAVDSAEGIRRLAEAMNAARADTGVAAVIDVFVELDVGQHRCGVAPGTAAVGLVHEIRRHPALRFAGLQAYHGGAQHLRGARERREAIGLAAGAVQATRAVLAAEGIAVPLVTGAGTGTLVCEAASGEWGELQAGSFLFMDADYAANERDPAQPAFEPALFVRTQVISVSATHAVCDAGHKAHAIESGLPRVHGAPEGLGFFNGGDEHGILRGPTLPQLGECLWLVPGHCDPTVNLHEHLIGVAGGLKGGVIDRILRVDARGALT
ncbi:DSD1 family PLP-dependent enzyme [Ramlibacter rhizophilus]|uniref:DSD1 family PLP-dependent enzyme n=1 Tax=Ramlibacter rhizophilus TaxID=1781167 RepID=A0A4Z0BJS1_9BURK|nr:DSD1 family PLP-dependent enzyme [Ramlibacter rhizophilus]TFY99572.1 DSD1 family PLP-dependent enzyme [Ramlibacter rhizophilus]